MTGLATPVKVFAFLVLVTAYVYLFGWASLARFMEGEIVISRKNYRSEAIKPPGLSEDEAVWHVHDSVAVRMLEDVVLD